MEWATLLRSGLDMNHNKYHKALNFFLPDFPTPCETAANVALYRE